MVETETQAWRHQIQQLFHEARTELRGILSELDQLTLLPPTLPPTLDRDLMCRDAAGQDLTGRIAAHRHEAADAPLVSKTEQRESTAEAANVGNDFSQRLDSLKRKLNQRIQDQTPLPEIPNSNPDEAP